MPDPKPQSENEWPMAMFFSICVICATIAYAFSRIN